MSEHVGQVAQLHDALLPGAGVHAHQRAVRLHDGRQHQLVTAQQAVRFMP